MDREAVLADLRRWLKRLDGKAVLPEAVLATIDMLEEWYE